ncbi:MAG: M14 family metallopeptidase [Meiothermus sp.]|uniref:succinylglutamate desuccinylase/aspartoacylase family protein n=1 Tax=Meiothermus sp. TaxID=1955249 RepID=UPI0025F6482A|nr:M14 family metallopeptidase [Meiothermus sp.]MCS7068633.1 M14 family metallopeptidase [Meiothermus sp.]MDW8424622.1 M14 family metallopeptidase [Meiothermus sp.]
MGVIRVGTARAKPGTTATGIIEVPGSNVEIPVIVFNGVKDGPCLWIDGAIHGDEPEGPLMCHILRREVNPEKLAGTLVLVPVINTPAFEAASRGNPLDTFSYDMNRIYPGRANGYFSERVAWAHREWMVRVADLELSIHSGGAHSYLSETIFATEDAQSQELARAMGEGWDLVLKSFLPKGNPMAVMLEAGKTGITVELGGRSATSPQAFHRVGRVLADAALNVMRHYKMIAGKPRYARPRYTGVQHALLAPSSGLFVAEPEIEFKKPMRKGDRIATIYNLYGDVLDTLHAPTDGRIFGLRALPNVLMGDWCCFYAEVQGSLE